MSYEFNRFSTELIFNLPKRVRKAFAIYRRPSRRFPALIQQSA
jgi:hypothetical protein